MKRLLIALAMVLLLTGCGGKAEPTKSPESVVRAFISALNAGDGPALTKTVTKASAADALIGLAFAKGFEVKTQISAVRVTYEGQVAWAEVTYIATIWGTRSEPETKTYGLIKEGGQWRIDLALTGR